MTYELAVDPDARSQIMALPTHALTFLADAMAMLELTPWNGAPLHKDNPGGAVRTLPFGRSGMITYLILDDLQRVDGRETSWEERALWEDDCAAGSDAQKVCGSRRLHRCWMTENAHVGSLNPTRSG